MKTKRNQDCVKHKIVCYFTSLRGIRKTYEDCCFVRTVLRGFHVAVDERDISMDSDYRTELQSSLGQEKPVCLPQVFVRAIQIGGVEEIKKLNDGGELGEVF
ncbi:Glutaredoxin family protein [Raphanus sativus]|nr:Glutaredoxin family protein [Raphanus sativus]